MMIISPDCPVASYPKVLGGPHSDSFLHQIDVHSTNIVASGWTEESDLTGKTYRVPYIVQYNDTYQEPLWGIWFDKPGYEAHGVTYSDDGQYILAISGKQSTDSFITLIKQIDGSLIGFP